MTRFTQMATIIPPPPERAGCYACGGFDERGCLCPDAWYGHALPPSRNLFAKCQRDCPVCLAPSGVGCYASSARQLRYFERIGFVPLVHVMRERPEASPNAITVRFDDGGRS